MSNKELADIFNSIADMLDIEGVKWEPNAYRKAAASILGLSEDIESYYKHGNLTDIEGIGKTLASHIEEYIKTGKIKKYEDLKKKYPIDFTSLRSVRGLGPMKIYALYKALNIKNLDDLKKAVEQHKISTVPGFSQKSEENIANNLNILGRKETKRALLGDVLYSAESLVDKLRKSGFFKRVEIAGSIRRRKETIGDIDILAISDDPDKATSFFVNLDDVKEVLVSGSTKTSVALKIGLNCDLRIVEEKSFGSAMQYFTGNKEHNITLRKIAISKGFKLNEYGLFSGDKLVASKTEKEVYNTLHLDEIPPEMREDMGEIELASEHKLPKLVEYEEIIGDMHFHFNTFDKISDLIDMAKRIGLKYIAIINYVKTKQMNNGLDEDKIFSYFNQIDKFNEKSDIKLLKGIEIEVGDQYDVSKKLIKESDLVIGTAHHNTKTENVIDLIKSGLISIFAHPTGRILLKNEGMGFNMDKIFQASKDNNIFLEINGTPNRLDLPFDLVKKARDYNIKFSLGSGGFNLNQMKYIELASTVARRGWLEKKDVINSLEYKDIIKLLKR